jgi:predicted Rossmann fold flavoprotein
MKYDVAIIGAGPTGLMAAVRAGELGARVILLEKNDRIGIKLLVTGGGRCNITNNSSDREIATAFGQNGAWLLSSLSRFGSSDMINFLEKNNLQTFTDEEGRVFPVSNSAKDILDFFINQVNKYNIEIRLNSSVAKLIKDKNKIKEIITQSGEAIRADKYIVCTGGRSYPGTGSTGDAHNWLEDLGHKIIKTKPGLTSLRLKNNFVPRVEGISFENVKACYTLKGSKKTCFSGKMIFTANGLSGSAIFNMSNSANREILDDVSFFVDLLPDITSDKLSEILYKRFKSSNKFLKNSLFEIIPSRFTEVIISLSGLDKNKETGNISKKEISLLVKNLKSLKLEIDKFEGYDKAMITSGGVSLKEVNPKNMKSKIIDNLYIAGELLDLAGFTGGYNLQLCWTSAYVAGSDVL